MSKPLAIENPENICFKCLKETDSNQLHKIEIPSMGYGSGFDGWSTKIHLCNECIKETDPKWWELNIVNEYEYHESYEYENEIFDFTNTLPIEGRELFWNRYSTDNYQMESQDWIDYELDLLPHDKCKEYGRYSPEEVRAYHERFPVCKHVKLIEYEDGSGGCRCSNGAFGNRDGTAEGHQPYSNCYECVYFDLREGEIITVNLKEEEIKRIEHQIKELTNKLQELRQ